MKIKTLSLAPMEAASFFFFEKDTADSGTDCPEYYKCCAPKD